MRKSIPDFLLYMHLILYDGDCALCHRAVSFISRHDKGGQFVFAPLLGKTAERFLGSWRFAHPEADTLVLVENYNRDPHIYAHGEAAVRIFSKLGFLFAPLKLGLLLPRSWLDGCYRFVAARRFSWFGKAACRLPEGVDKARFLE